MQEYLLYQDTKDGRLYWREPGEGRTAFKEEAFRYTRENIDSGSLLYVSRPLVRMAPVERLGL